MAYILSVDLKHIHILRLTSNIFTLYISFFDQFFFSDELLSLAFEFVIRVEAGVEDEHTRRRDGEKGEVSMFFFACTFEFFSFP